MRNALIFSARVRKEKSSKQQRKRYKNNTPNFVNQRLKLAVTFAMCTELLQCFISSDFSAFKCLLHTLQNAIEEPLFDFINQIFAQFSLSHFTLYCCAR